MDIIYKRKANKIKLVNLNELNSSISGKSKFWRENIIREEMKNMDFDLDDLYAK
jgi:hypothetical protein